jgi:uncharacterized protein
VKRPAAFAWSLFASGGGRPDLAQTLQEQLTALVEAMAPWLQDETVPNLLSAQQGTTPKDLRVIYGPERYDRLVAIKKRYDSRNLFRVNHNIVENNELGPSAAVARSQFLTPKNWPVGHLCSSLWHVPASAGAMTMSRRSSPPFSWETATEKVRAIEDRWNSREPILVALEYTIDSVWRNGIEFLSGRAAIEVFLERKWAAKLEYRRVNELWALTDNRIAVRFAYECCDASSSWYRAYGNEDWEFGESGLIRQRFASTNQHPIAEGDRMFRWCLGRRPDDYPELSDFDL